MLSFVTQETKDGRFSFTAKVSGASPRSSASVSYCIQTTVLRGSGNLLTCSGDTLDVSPASSLLLSEFKLQALVYDIRAGKRCSECLQTYAFDSFHLCKEDLVDAYSVRGRVGGRGGVGFRGAGVGWGAVMGDGVWEGQHGHGNNSQVVTASLSILLSLLRRTVKPK